MSSFEHFNFIGQKTKAQRAKKLVQGPITKEGMHYTQDGRR